ncbi:MAG TPA: protein-L-isoaspartate(D-aspartate) O-methyltransferase [Anaeromyxobacteraceae bacterium]|nr:protein-L-isoaspartate(D-aspartate) O-methyltransferase [Anaeromyxobacteraceae bacterium]
MVPVASLLPLLAAALAASVDGSVEERARAHMVATQIAARDVSDPRVLEAMRKVERHRFVPASLREEAYGDHPLPIGHDQTISQPYVVALMTELARVRPGARVLEVGTGSGYQAAILAVLAKEVYTIEIVEPLAREAGERLRALGYANVTVRAGDGYRGWPEHAPFDAILVTAAPREIPQPLLDQLAVGGRLVAPVGDEGGDQELVVVERTPAGLRRWSVAPVRFVPMTGEAKKRR